MREEPNKNIMMKLEKQAESIAKSRTWNSPSSFSHISHSMFHQDRPPRRFLLEEKNNVWTEEELKEVFYQWDAQSFPVMEYHSEERKEQGEGEEGGEEGKGEGEEEEEGEEYEQHEQQQQQQQEKQKQQQDKQQGVFLSTLDTTDTTHIVEFYAPWCPHCQHTKPHYIAVAKQVLSRSVVSNRIFFHAVSCTLYPDICSYYQIDGYPTIMAWGPHIVSQEPYDKLFPKTRTDNDTDTDTDHDTDTVTDHTRNHPWMDLSQPGFILNAEGAPYLTADYIATVTNLELVLEKSHGGKNKKTKRQNQNVNHTHRIQNDTNTNTIEEEEENEEEDDYYQPWSEEEEEEGEDDSEKQKQQRGKQAALLKMFHYEYLPTVQDLQQNMHMFHFATNMILPSDSDILSSHSSLLPNPNSILHPDPNTFAKVFRFHDAEASLVFLLEHAISSSFTNTPLSRTDTTTTTTTTTMMETTLQSLAKKLWTLYDFLQWVDWASPSFWNIRTEMIQKLLHSLDTLLYLDNRSPRMKEDEDSISHTNDHEKDKIRQHANKTFSSSLFNNPSLQEMYKSQLLNHILHAYRRPNGQNTTHLKNPSLSFGSSLPIQHWTTSCTHVYSRMNHKNSSSISTYGAWQKRLSLHRDKDATATANTHLDQEFTPIVPRTKGLTCGLWSLFHILTIGSSLPPHQMYGHRRGYPTSSYHVSKTLRNFISFFFPCDVCRMNFIQMYDSCGHNHCHRFISSDLPSFLDDPNRIPFHGDTIKRNQSKKNPTWTRPYETLDSAPNVSMQQFLDSPTREGKDLVLWFWEVHNAVNVRIVKESAERDMRTVSLAETLAGKFPTQTMCPRCWNDAIMEDYNREEVYHFLRGIYWPGYNAPKRGGRRLLRAIHMGHDPYFSSMEEIGTPLSPVGLFMIVIPLGVVVLMFLHQSSVIKIIMWKQKRTHSKRN